MKVTWTSGKQPSSRRPRSPRRTQAQQVIVVQQPQQPRFGLPRRRGTPPVPVVPFQEWAEKDSSVESTWHRNRRQIYPWFIPVALLGCSAVLQAVAWFGVDRPQLAAVVAVAGGLAALIAARVGAGRLKPRWRARVYGWAVAGWAWLITTVLHRLTWTMVAVLILITVTITSRWWADHRPGNPTRPPATPNPDDDDAPPAAADIVGNFTRYGSCKGGPAEGCTLHKVDISDARAVYTMNIRPGKDSLNKMLQRMDVIGTAVKHPPEDLMLEATPGDPNQLRFTVITRSPVKDTVRFTEPGWREDGPNAWIEAGTWADGEGRVRIPVLGPNSAWNAAFLATMGGGKTTLFNLLALSARASGRAVLWYLDGKGGASSPVLRDYADWAPGGISKAEIRARGQDVLTAIEALIEARQLQMKIEGLSGITPTPERPLLILFIDECHLFFDPNDKKTVQRWNDVARVIRSLAIVIWAATQYPKINSFGNESDLKEGLGGRTMIAGKIRNPTAGGLLNVAFNPSQLPAGGGWWFIDAEDGRSAMWRSDFLDDTRTPGKRDSQADQWFKKTPGAELEERALRGLPEFYRRRAELAEEERQRLLRGYEGHAAPVSVPAKLSLVPEGGWQPNWPTPPAPRASAAEDVSVSPPVGLAGRHGQVWSEIAAGRDTQAAISSALELGQSRVYELLGELERAGHIRKAAGRGRYELTE